MRLIIGICAVLLAGAASTAMAQTTADGGSEALSRCLAMKTSGEDRLVVARWFAAALASSSEVADVVKVNLAAKDAADRAFGALVTRLFAVDCAGVAGALVKNHDLSTAVKPGFATLGMLAVQELTGDPAASAEMVKFGKYVDDEKMKKLGQ